MVPHAHGCPFPPRICASGGSSKWEGLPPLLPVPPHLADFFLVFIDPAHHVRLHESFSPHLSVHEGVAPSLISDLCSPVPPIRVELLKDRDCALYIFIVFYF